MGVPGRRLQGLSYAPTGTIANPIGWLGAQTAYFAFKVLGRSAYLLTRLAGIWSGILFMRKQVPDLGYKAAGAAIFVLSTASLEALLHWRWLSNRSRPITEAGGGWLGATGQDLFGIAAIPIALLLVAISVAGDGFLFYRTSPRGST